MKANVIIVNALYKKGDFVWRVESHFNDIEKAKQFVEILNESPYLSRVEFTEGYNYDYNNLADKKQEQRKALQEIGNFDWAIAVMC